MQLVTSCSSINKPWDEDTSCDVVSSFLFNISTLSTMFLTRRGISNKSLFLFSLNDEKNQCIVIIKLTEGRIIKVRACRELVNWALLVSSHKWSRYRCIISICCILCTFLLGLNTTKNIKLRYVVKQFSWPVQNLKF